MKKGTCFYYKKLNHYKVECHFLKKKNAQGETKQEFVAMISKINVHKDNEAWWNDSGATKHMCKDKSLFQDNQTSTGYVYSFNKNIHLLHK